MKLNLRTTGRERQKKWTEKARGCARIFFVKVSSGTHCLTGISSKQYVTKVTMCDL